MLPGNQDNHMDVELTVSNQPKFHPWLFLEAVEKIALYFNQNKESFLMFILCTKL